ncbi:MAG: Flp pilus assembly pilin Flp [Myxococcota bacterium]|jgi:Flp pilus assembly pilin Flp
MRRLTDLLMDESASTGIEYALIATLVSVGIIASLIAFAESASKVWTYASTAITSALN